jgi:hypothetical protein
MIFLALAFIIFANKSVFGAVLIDACMLRNIRHHTMYALFLLWALKRYVSLRIHYKGSLDRGEGVFFLVFHLGGIEMRQYFIKLKYLLFIREML